MKPESNIAEKCTSSNNHLSRAKRWFEIKQSVNARVKHA